MASFKHDTFIQDIQSVHPIKVHWAGMESDTVRMQRAGWNFMMDYRYEYMAFQFAMRYGSIGMACMFEEMQIEMLLKGMPIIAHTGPPRGQDQVIIRSGAMEPSWRAIDMGAGMRNEHDMQSQGMSTQYSLYEKFEELFPEPSIVAAPEEKEIIVPDQHTVDDLLEFILKKQAPGQAEIRDRNKRREGRATRRAQIVTPDEALNYG